MQVNITIHRDGDRYLATLTDNEGHYYRLEQHLLAPNAKPMAAFEVGILSHPAELPTERKTQQPTELHQCAIIDASTC